jgi:UDPglucose 6-dehydrogenase
MKIAVIGAGYVGLVTGLSFADLGHSVSILDIDSEKIEALRNGTSPIYEKYIHRYMKSENVKYTTEYNEAVFDADIVFVAVGTPTIDGQAYLKPLFEACERAAELMKPNSIMVIKSTVPIGTTRKIKEALYLDKRGVSIVSNPEFLREGSAFEDFLNPDRIVVGYDKNQDTYEVISRLYSEFEARTIFTTYESAEMIKYASNSFLALKVAFINEIADLCEATGANVKSVALGMGYDTRIGRGMLRPGPGFGGSCFPKDTLALLKTANDHGLPMSTIRAAVDANLSRKTEIGKKLEKFIGDPPKRVAVLGLAFKAETDDVRDSPAIEIVGELLRRGYDVVVHDPEAIDNAIKEFNHKKMHPEIQPVFPTVLDGADAVVLAVDWEHYRNLLSLPDAPKKVFDLRNMLDPDEARAAGISFMGIGIG